MNFLNPRYEIFSVECFMGNTITKEQGENPNMNHQRLKQQLDRQYKRKLQDFSGHIGDTLKKKRLELDLTQEKASQGVCSVSYYSKIENNRTEPSDAILRDMSDRIGVDLNAYSILDEDENVLKEAIKAYYNDDPEYLEQLVKRLGGIECGLLRDVIELFESRLRNDFKCSRKLLKGLLPLVGNINVLSAMAVLTAAVAHNYHLGQYREALQLLHIMEDINTLEPRLDIIKNFYAFLVKPSVGRAVSSIPHYCEVADGFTKYPHTARILSLKMHMVRHLARENKAEAEKMLMCIPRDSIPSAMKNFHEALRLLCLDVENNPVKVLEERLDASNRDIWFYRSLTLLCRKHRDDSRFRKMAVEHFHHAGEEALLEKTLFHSLTLTDEKDLTGYLREICLPLAIDRGDAEYIGHFALRLEEMLKKNARYKEALRVMVRAREALDELRTFRL